jgi:hypothetical protein
LSPALGLIAQERRFKAWPLLAGGVTALISHVLYTPMRASIPQRIPPLTWRRPAVLWTPASLAAAIAWPLALVQDDPPLQHIALLAGFAMFAVALVTLSVSWVTGRPPKTRRVVVLHVLAGGALTALAGPSLLSAVLHAEAAASLAAAPLALVVMLPAALISGLIFAVLALMSDDRRITETPDGHFKITARVR